MSWWVSFFFFLHYINEKKNINGKRYDPQESEKIIQWNTKEALKITKIK